MMTTTNNPCVPRRRFTMQAQAAAAAARINRSIKTGNNADMRHPVPCGKCHGWHLS